MRCPNCQNRVAPFVKWLLWPGPKTTCLSCGSRLRYKNFFWAAGLHVVLGACWGFFDFPLLILSGILPVTAIVYPWFFAQYELVA